MTAPDDPGSGGLQVPSPDDAERWNQLVPGAAERILDTMQTLALVQAQRAQNEHDERLADQQLASASLGVAALLSFILIVASIVFLAFGNVVAGGILLGVPAAGVAVSFIPKAIASRRED